MIRLACLILAAGFAGTVTAAPADIEGRWLSGDGDGLVEIRLAGDGLRGVVLGSTAAGIGVFGRFLIGQYKGGRLYRGSAEWQEHTAAQGNPPEEGQE